MNSMYSLFGTKWCKLHLGPLWSFEPIMQEAGGDTDKRSTKSRKIDDVSSVITKIYIQSVITVIKLDQARVNIPGIHERSIRRDISSSMFTTGASIQVQWYFMLCIQHIRNNYTLFLQYGVLDLAVKVLPHVHWWIKADGVDVVSGLGDSCGGQWSGDVDLNDGSVRELFDKYTQRCEFIAEIGLVRTEIYQIEQDLMQVEAHLKDDLGYLCDGEYSYDCKIACTSISHNQSFQH